MKKIKIIDLLNKIANGEEVPKLETIEDFTYYFYTEIKDITSKIGFVRTLNSYVEIAKDTEENEEIIQLNTDWYKEVDMNDITNIQIALECLTDRLNEVIDIVNKLNKKEGK